VDAPDLSLKTGKLNWAEEVRLFDWKRKTMMGLLLRGFFFFYSSSFAAVVVVVVFHCPRGPPVGNPDRTPLFFSQNSERRSGALMSIEEDARNSIEIILYFKSLTLSFFLSFV